jgi:hypothetical protein
MYNFNEDAIREAAYFIWKNNGCPSNSNLSDWDAAINQLSAQAAIKLKAPKKASSVKVLMPKKAAVKATTLRNVKSIILKPATYKASSSTTAKSLTVKASASAATKKTAVKATVAKKTVAKKTTNKKSK